MPLSNDEIQRIQQSLSEARFQTYLDAVCQNLFEATTLYEWNVRISSALTIPLHFFEIVNRNAILSAIIEVYGADWYETESFRLALPNPRGNFYSPRNDLSNVVRNLRYDGVLSAGKVVAELKFVFWEQMLTKRHDKRLWERYFTLSYPHSGDEHSYWQLRAEAKEIVSKTREIRNRIAHHEPIFSRDVVHEYQNIIKLIGWCNHDVVSWLNEFDEVPRILEIRPNFF